MTRQRKVKETAKKESRKQKSREEIEAHLDATSVNKLIALRKQLELVTRDRANVESLKEEAMKSFNNQLRGFDEDRKNTLESIDNVLKPMPLLDDADLREDDDQGEDDE